VEMLLLAGNDITVIALWLGHEQVSTTNLYLHADYLHADMTHKQHAIDRTTPLGAARPGHYQHLPPTPCSPSSKDCDYADPMTALHRPTRLFSPRSA